jgi:phosphatidylglycerophosphate synthase
MLKANLNSRDVDRLLLPLSRLGLHPTAWSVLALAVAFAGFASLALHSLALGLAFFAISGFIDMVDGAVARATGTASTKGAFVDGVLDRYVEALLALGIMIYLGEMEYLSIPVQVWVFVLLFGSLMTSFVRAYADHRGLVKDPEMQKKMGGLVERAERLILLYIGMALGLYSPELLGWMVVAVALLSNATVLQRMAFALKQGK